MARPQTVALIFLTAATALLWAGQGAASKTADMAGAQPAPAAVGCWMGTRLPVDHRVFEILETTDVSAMEYRQPNDQPVWLSQVSGFGKRAAFHPPELCFVGSHYEVLERGQATVMMHGRPQRVMRLVVGRGADRMEAWYWFTANGRVTPNYYQQQWWLLQAQLRWRPAAGTLVRISTPLDDPVKARARLAAFADQWSRAGEPVTADTTPSGQSAARASSATDGDQVAGRMDTGTG